LRLVDCGEKQALVVRELLAGLGGARRVHDGHEIIGAQPALDELMRGSLDPNAARKPCVEIVDDHDVDAPVERRLVRSHVRLERRARIKRPIRALDGNVNLREGADRLRLAVFEDLEVLLLQVPDKVPLPVGDDDVHLHVVDTQLECRRLRLLRARLLRRRLLRRRRLLW